MRLFPSLLTALLLLIAGCGSDVNEGGGTSVSNPPTVESSALSPDFDNSIFDSAITDPEATTSESAFLATAEPSYLSGPAANWNDFFLEGPITQARIFRTRLQIWAERLAELVEDEGSELSTTPQVFLIEEKKLVDVTKTWRVLVSLRDDNLIKAVIRNAVNGDVWGYYLLETDASGNLERGLFSYVNPDKLGNASLSGVRFLGVSFDFADTAANSMSFTLDAYDANRGHFVVLNIDYECNSATKDCIGEFLRIVSEPPSREISSQSVRFGWNDDNKTVCIAPIIYDSGVTIGETQEFTGPAVPSEEDIVTGSCSIATPFWSERIFGADDFPQRYEDDGGGFAGELYGDGSSETTWESIITVDTIEDWLLGRF